ncbi:MAG TPA: (2Fe-2S)-binding protein [Acidimicrobiales bacterium]|nr:(2Fe-2S)-binding protein [Acidimicrobiales bacterium]
MYACLCRAVPERSVRDAVAAGASTVSAVRATCGAGTGCGGCLPSLKRLLRECLGAEPVCTAAATLDPGRGLLEPTCSASCAQSVGATGEPMCVAGLAEGACAPCDTAVVLIGPPTLA